MTQVTVNQKKGQFGHVPYGNVSALIFRLQADRNGLLLGTNHKTLLQTDDVVTLGVLPEGFLPLAYRAITDEKFNAGAFDVGFSYVDGVDDARYPQAATGLLNLPTLTTKGNATNGVIAPKTLPKDAHLNLTVTTAPTAGNDAGCLTIVLIGVLQGHE